MPSNDVKLFFLLRFMRVCAYGGSTLILSSFLSDLGISDVRIGVFMTATLAGDVVVSIFTSLIADRLGRRWMLAFGSSLMAVSGVVFATCENFWFLLTASVLGVISPSGGDIGPFKAIEESTLAHLLPSEDLNATLAWYYTLGSCGGALGLLSTGWLLQYLQANGMSTLDAYRVVFWLYAVIGLLKTFFTLFLSALCEANQVDIVFSEDSGLPPTSETEPLLLSHAAKPSNSTSAATRRFLIRFCPILVFDNFGTGLSTDSWLAYFVRRKFSSISDGLLGSIFSTCSVIISLSNILAIPVTSRLGNVRTMILGHSLASISLMLLPLPDRLDGTVLLLISRAIFLDFDQASRQTFIAQSVPSEERTATMGVINMVRTLAQSVGPFVTGHLAQAGSLGLSFVVAGVIKCLYDILLAVVFLSGK